MKRLNCSFFIIVCAMLISATGCGPSLDFVDGDEEVTAFADAGNDAGTTDTGTAADTSHHHEDTHQATPDAGVKEDTAAPEPECTSENAANVCDDGNVCTKNVCKGGKCVYHTEELNGKECHDGQKCTINDNCVDGKCVGYLGTACNDNNPCTVDKCDELKGGCVNSKLNSGECDDGNACTSGDTCKAGKCSSGANTCECTVDSDCADDGNLCNGTLTCNKAGKCVVKEGSITPACVDDDVCNNIACNPKSGKCESNADKSAKDKLCGEGKACTDDGKCVIKKVEPKCIPSECKDNNPCTAEKCVDDKCVHWNVNASCNDGDACTEKDHCQAGKCEGWSVNCTDGNYCTVDKCDQSKGCVSSQTADGSSCSDGNPQTLGEVCVDGFCKAPEPMPAKCSKDEHCTNNNKCDGVEACVEGQCLAGKPLNCDDGADCSTDSCNPISGCKHLPDNSKCPGGLCLASQVNIYYSNSIPNGCYQCDPLTSGYYSNNACSDNNNCTQDSCSNAGKCVYKKKDDGDYCNDGNPCTYSTACKAGKCEGTTYDCDDNDAKTADSCNSKTGKCVNTPIPDEMLKLKVGGTAETEPYAYWEDNNQKWTSEHGYAPAAGFYKFTKIKLADVCAMSGLKIGVRVWKVNPTDKPSWYHDSTDPLAPKDYSDITVMIADKKVTTSLNYDDVKSGHSGAPHLFVAKADLGCP